MKFNKTVLEQSKKLYGVAQSLSLFFPDLKIWLDQSDLRMEPIPYLAYNLFGSLMMSVMSLFGGLFILILGGWLSIVNFLVLFLLAIFFGLFQIGVAFLQPKVIASKRVRLIEKDLLFALRHLLIKLRSGVTLFDSMNGLTKGYDVVSEEFRRIVSEISSGKKEIEALEEAAYRNPSPFFRRAVWQISSSMRAGADIADTLSNIVSNLSQEQRIMIRKYGAELNPFALIYMMTTVIMPTLGIALLTVLSSFSGFQLNEYIFIAIYVFLFIFQYMFMGIVKTRRPIIEI